jgi:hypothetical protein
MEYPNQAMAASNAHEAKRTAESIWMRNLSDALASYVKLLRRADSYGPKRRAKVFAAVEALEAVVDDITRNLHDDPIKWDLFYTLDQAGEKYSDSWLNYLAARILWSVSNEADWLRPHCLRDEHARQALAV